MKALDFDYYSNGFSLESINCIDMPIAGALGYYCHEYYYYYCFYYSLYNNWREKANIEDKDHHWLWLRNRIVGKLGLALTPHVIKKDSDIISFIKTSIDNGKPVILLLKYNACFYSPWYMNSKNESVHSVIVSEYDTENSTITIRDQSFVGGDYFQYLKAQPLYKLQLTEEMIAEMWRKSNAKMKAENNQFYKTAFTLDRKGPPAINSYYDLLADMSDKFECRSSKLTEYIHKFDALGDTAKYNNLISFYMQTFCNSLHMIFSIYYTLLDGVSASSERKEEFSKFEKEYMESRAHIISALHAHALKLKPLDTGKKNAMIDKILPSDKKLFEIFSTLIHKMNQDSQIDSKPTGPNRELINFALNAKATADSQYDDMHGAQNALNSHTINFLNNAWVSDASQKKHWLKVDLGREREIRLIKIVHIGPEGYYAVDFTLQGRNKNQAWVELAKVKDNDESVTVIDVSPARYRYFRLYITNPSRKDFIGRVNNFEIWGENDGV